MGKTRNETKGNRKLNKRFSFTQRFVDTNQMWKKELRKEMDDKKNNVSKIDKRNKIDYCPCLVL